MTNSERLTTWLVRASSTPRTASRRSLTVSADADGSSIARTDSLTTSRVAMLVGMRPSSARTAVAVRSERRERSSAGVGTGWMVSCWRVTRSMPRSRPRSRGSAIVMATPSRPARPVRPTRWT